MDGALRLSVMNKGVEKMDKCPKCNTFLEVCPCCEAAFCPDCRSTEDEMEEDEEEEI